MNNLRSAITPRLVAIAGGSGSGKSWLTDRLQKIFGGNIARLSLDDFYLDRSHLSASRREQINYDHPCSIDWARVEQVLQDCRAGLPGRLPRYDFKTHTRMAGEKICHPKALILMDGLWLLLYPAIRRLFHFSIFIDCSERLRLRRRLARDLAERGRSGPSIRRQFKETVSPMHDQFVAPQAPWANVVLRQPLRDADVSGLSDQLRSLLPTSAAYPAWMRETSQIEPRTFLKPATIYE
jgi:uridine kinase